MFDGQVRLQSLVSFFPKCVCQSNSLSEHLSNSRSGHPPCDPSDPLTPAALVKLDPDIPPGEAFAPTVALVESDLGMMFPAFMDPVETFGEVGAVYALARDAGVVAYTWEPPNEVLVASLMERGSLQRKWQCG